ncbi:MAG: acyl-CoA dehydrogenase family protein [Myxococcota bacterium]
MDFRLTDDQQALRDAVRSFCEGRIGADSLRELEEKGAFDPGLWRELAEMGVFSLRLPEDAGGVGLGMADAVLVFAELGRCLAPGPLVWSHLAAGRVDGAESGATVVGGLDLMDGQHGPLLLEHFEQLDALLVLRPEGVHRVERSAISAAVPVELPLDPLTPLHQATALPDGERIAGADEAAALRREGTALAAAQLFGIAEATALLAVDYAKKREQFGRPIGSFQAVKHLLSDMFVRQEVARAACYAAGVTLDDPAVGDVAQAVSAAKVTAGEAGLRNSRACIQVLGGMGYTWEVPAHYYLKRSWVLENLFGTHDEHAESLARLSAASPGL